MDTAIRFPKLTLLLLAAALVCSFVQGAIIGFTQKGWAPGDLSTNGSLVMAVNLGTTLDATVEGVTFRGDSDGSYTANAVTATFFGADYVAAAHPGLYDGATFPTGTDAQNLACNTLAQPVLVLSRTMQLAVAGARASQCP
jgi:hypothetical protein